jgi:hypothetical protein
MSCLFIKMAGTLMGMSQDLATVVITIIVILGSALVFIGSNIIGSSLRKSSPVPAATPAERKESRKRKRAD